MTRRDNAPKKRKTNKQLPQNIDELVNKAKGKPREAWRQSVERLEKRIRKAEEETGQRVDIESMFSQEVSDYILYGTMPRGAIRRERIYDVEKIRIKDIKEMLNEAPDIVFYGGTQPANTDFHVSSKEIEELRENIEMFSSPYFKQKFQNALDMAIAAYGEDNVAAQVAAKFETLKVDLGWAHRYELSDADKAERYYNEFNLILMNTPLSVEENIMATQAVEAANGVESE